MEVRYKRTISAHADWRQEKECYALCLLARASPSMTEVPIIIRTAFKSLSWNGRIPVACCSLSSGLASVRSDML